MELIRGLHNLRQQHRGCVATIGNFDGVHLGHANVLQQVVERAKALNLPSVAIIFEPQPREFFQGEQAPPRLTRFRDKLELLAEHNIDRVVCLHFNQHLRSLTAEAFVDQLLLNGLDVKYFVVGDDFRFGCDRAGDFELLQQKGQACGFVVESTATFAVEDDRVSSTRVRQALSQHDFELAHRLLGRTFSISGKVMHGRKLGRQIGVPTANISLKNKPVPFQGVCVVKATWQERDYFGVANIGNRPTVNGEAPLLEVHLFDFNESIYGQRLQVRFLAHIRAEKKFSGLEELEAQIKDDMAQARAWLKQYAQNDK